jgi:hypothetical protein
MKARKQARMQAHLTTQSPNYLACMRKTQRSAFFERRSADSAPTMLPNFYLTNVTGSLIAATSLIRYVRFCLPFQALKEALTRQCFHCTALAQFRTLCVWIPALTAHEITKLYHVPPMTKKFRKRPSLGSFQRFSARPVLTPCPSSTEELL